MVTSESPAGAAASSARRLARFVPFALVLAVSALVLFPPLGESGLWDPYELDAADRARRIAIHVFGARGLELPGAPASLPTLTDLGMGELPFSSMALGFRLFGLHEWAGRLPLALWALAGVLSVFGVIARLVHPRAGLYAAVALVTMPLYFLHARTMLGDGVTMAAHAMALSGLVGLLLDSSSPWRLLWGAVLAVGLVAGFASRGLLLGVAVPLVSVGAGWAALRASGLGTGGGGIARVAIGASCLVLGIAAAAVALASLSRARPDAPLSRLLGVALIPKAPTEATFDLYVRQLGHALFPWSAFVPLAFGRLFAPPRGGTASSELCAIVVVAAGVAFAAWTFLAPRTGQIPFGAPAVLAIAAGLAVWDLEQQAEDPGTSSRALALATVVLAFVLHRDFIVEPQKVLAAMAVDKASFPKSFEPASATVIRVVLALFAVPFALAWSSAARDAAASKDGWLVDTISRYSSALAALSRVWGGNLVFAAIVFEAALVGLGAMLFFGRGLGWSAVDRLPRNFAQLGLNAWWSVPLALAVIVPIVDVARMAFARTMKSLRLPPASATVIGAAAAGLVLSLHYYPALAAQLSPKEVFESYARLRKPGEPLGLLGVQARAAAYHDGAGAEALPDATRAFAWLTEREDQRRWLVVKADDLPKLNSLYRKLERKNLPVLDGRSSQILLVSNQLGSSRNESWIEAFVLDEPRAPARPIDATFEDQLQTLGWEVVDDSGRVVQDVVPQTTYTLRFYYRVLKPITGSWKAFVHVDGFQRRFNGDHAVLDGRYPMSLWQPGDLVVDQVEMRLEPNFTPGDYFVYYGFFSGETRFRVTSGPHHDNRVVGGPLRVR